RDFHVTGVQTCALPICPLRRPGQLAQQLDEQIQPALSALVRARASFPLSFRVSPPDRSRRRAPEVGSVCFKPIGPITFARPHSPIGSASCRERAITIEP